MFKYFKFFLIALIIISGSGCAYFNTFFNAKQSYKSGSKKLEKIKSGQLSSDIKNDFEKAIEKSWKLIDVYSDSNKYADDALLLIGKAHYQIKEYEKTERYLTQFVVRYVDSELIPEAKLWLARSLVHLKREEEALNRFNEILEGESDRDIAAYALYGLGELYLKKEDYSNAIINLKRCLEVSDDDKISAEAQFFIGNIYFEREEYAFAIENYSHVLKYETPLNIDFESQYKKATAEIYTGKFDEASSSLLKMLRADRYREKFGLIQAKLGECYELQGDTDAATRQYLFVISDFPRTEGASFASYQLAQLMEHTYADMDSARKLYLRATKEYNQFEFKQEATKRAEILNTYLDIKDEIAYDMFDFERVSKMDSAQINELMALDSLNSENDTTNIDFFSDTDNAFTLDNAFNDSNLVSDQTVDENEQNSPDNDNTVEDKEEEQQSDFPDLSDRFKFSTDTDDSTLAQTQDSLQKPLDINFDRVKSDKQRKIRHKTDIEISLRKNFFKLAEFFLLTMQNYDSAEAAYSTFITLYDDSTFTPKAYHALNYIYTFIQNDPQKKDSIEQIILNKYPGTEYADYISKKDNSEQYHEEEKEEIDPYKDKYLAGENELFDGGYKEAIDIFNSIMLEDSSGLWGKKACYAIAWIYENKLGDIPKAIESYTLLNQKYPESEFASIAYNKIKEPPPEISIEDSTSMINAIPADSMAADIPLDNPDDELKADNGTGADADSLDRYEMIDDAERTKTNMFKPGREGEEIE